jgi:hypothetical protein
VSVNKVKQTYLIGVVAIVLLALVSWFFLVSPRMAQASEIGEHRAAVEALNVKSATQITALTSLKNGLVRERQVAAALAVKFPPTADQPTLFGQVVAAAKKAGIPETSITSLGPAAPILGSPSSGAKLPSAPAVPAGKEGADGKAATPVKAVENMATMAISFNAQGSFGQMVAMLHNLEDLDRSFLITQVNLSSADKGKFTIAVQGNMYVHRAVPDPDAKVVPVVVPTPMAAATQAVNP